MNKRGLAPVISVALITLGVVIAVTILWFFAKDTIQTKNKVVDPDCFTADLSVTSCQTYGYCSYFTGSGIYNADILIKRGPGKGNITGIRFSFEDWISRKTVYDANLTSLLPGYTLEELQSLRFNNYPARIPSSGPNNTVRVIPLIGKSYDVCPLASQPLRCSPVSDPPPVGTLFGLTETAGQCCQCPRNETECYNGNDITYPIINGIVNYDPDGAGPIAPAVYPYGFPPGNLSVCCNNVPTILANVTINGFTFPPLGGACPSV